jgi:hypothetical protein
LKRNAKNGARVKVDTANQFIGLDAYQKVIDSGVDVVLLATPRDSARRIWQPVSRPTSTSSAKNRSPQMPPASAGWGRRPQRQQRRNSRWWRASAGAIAI